VSRFCFRRGVRVLVHEGERVADEEGEFAIEAGTSSRAIVCAGPVSINPSDF